MERGVTQEDFAAQCKLDRSYVSKIERGTVSPTLRKINMLAAALKISMQELLRRVEETLKSG